MNSFSSSFSSILKQSSLEDKLYISPILLISIFTFMNAFTSWSGPTYFVIVFIVSIIKIFFNGLFNDSTDTCNDRNGLKYSYSPFIYSFTIAYAFLPMILFKDPNVILIILILFVFLLDSVVRYNNNPECFTVGLVVSQVFQGTIFGLSICYLLYNMGLSWLLFTNKTKIETRPSNQQLRCKLYKNGELITNN
jgi:hypothetical protein